MSFAPQMLLILFVVIKISQESIESFLSIINRRYYSDPARQAHAQKVLGLNSADMTKTLNYTLDKHRFGLWESWITTAITLLFIVGGGFGWCENVARHAFGVNSPNSILVGLLFFASLSILGGLLSLPFEIYQTFVIEEKHGFNRQTIKGFIMDRIKGLLLGAVLGGVLLTAILWTMERMGSHWWIWTWLVIFGFSLLTAWLYPTFLAPIFNKFTPLEDGELKTKIFDLAKKVTFAADGISVMDASTRSSHGNAYFTGVFGKKKIVLFDNLLKSMGADEIVAVMAHELGHFKLHHIRWALIRSFFMTGLMFYALSLCLPLEPFYHAFGLSGVSQYGALVVFSLWFSPLGFVIQPISSYLSRRNEFAADAFALQQTDNKRLLGDALLKLRENNQAMPISHPWFSAWYHSHPPMLERLKAMGYIG